MTRLGRITAIVVLVAVFGAAGLFKLVDAGSFQEQFAHLGLPHWWVSVTGAVELLGAALIALSKPLLRRSGAAMLAATMAVATALHLLHDPIALALPASALMLLSVYVAFTARSEVATQGLAGA